MRLYLWYNCRNWLLVFGYQPVVFTRADNKPLNINHAIKFTL